MSNSLPAPTKVVAVHLNYRSKARERGVVPAFPTYFLKPPSTISAGSDVRRPAGCELFAFEGEIAIVIGTRASRVPESEALTYVAGYAAANDLGVYDLRYADNGSNVRSKGWDGSTPLGELIPADEIDPADLSLRTLVNGEVAQEADVTELIFPLARLVSDLSHAMTLEPGDIVLAGTPAGSRPVAPGDEIEVVLAGRSRVRSRVIEDDRAAAPGAPPPVVTEQLRASANGRTAPRPVELTSEARTALLRVGTATLTAQLLRRGIRSTFLGGLRPTRPDLRLLGYAHTLRYVALREDQLERLSTGMNAQKRVIESVSPDEVIVIEARNDPGAGTIGDVLALRALRRGCAGIVTDGGVRDSPAVAALELPVYFQAPHGSVLSRIHLPLESNVPITCAGVLVLPGDVVVGDAEGAVVIPAPLAEEVARDALAQEEQEAFVLERVDAGESIDGLFPLAPERLPELEAWRAGRRRQDEG